MADDKERNGAGEAEVAGTAEETAAVEAAEPPARPAGRAGVWLGLLALLVALAAAAAGGYAYWRLDQRLAAVGERLSASEQEGKQAREAVADVRGQVASVRQAQQDLAERADGLADQASSLRQATEELFARIEGGPTYWRLERVESLLLVADRVLRLERDSQAAYAALAEADRILRELKDPAWLDVREAIQGGMTRLEQVPNPDLPGIAFRLASLGEAALDLPLKRQQAPAMGGSPEAAASPAGEGGEADDLWSRVKGALGEFWGDVKGLVRLRRSGEDIEPLLPPDKAAFLRHNLVLNLQAARLAALRGQPEVYRESLSSARAWVDRFFDADSDEVAGMAAALADLEGRRIAPDLPDLEEPLRVFRRVRQERGS
jgi:uncharacterized protein HemX